ncbi:unnamed protein product, partial [Chrysoparadoxa australica]
GAEGQALTEAQNINLSLTLLGDVLSALSKYHRSMAKGGKAVDMPYIPYRNSKLTYLLKDSLGGNCKTLMMCNVRSAPLFFQQTMTSLRYAARARDIKNVPHRVVDASVTGSSGGQGQSLRGTVAEIDRLRAQLEQRNAEFEKLSASSKAADTGKEEKEKLEGQLKALRLKNRAEKEEMDRLLKSVIHSQKGELEGQKAQYYKLQATMEQHSRAVEELKGERNEALEKISSLQDEVLQLTAANEALRIDLQAAKETASDEDVQTYKKALKKMAKEREKLKAKASEQEAAAAEAT